MSKNDADEAVTVVSLSSSSGGYQDISLRYPPSKPLIFELYLPPYA
jgi:hypothetical protein